MISAESTASAKTSNGAIHSECFGLVSILTIVFVISIASEFLLAVLGDKMGSEFVVLMAIRGTCCLAPFTAVGSWMRWHDSTLYIVETTLDAKNL